MALNKYRVWICISSDREEYRQFEDMHDLAYWFCTADKPLGGWGIEQYASDNTWVDAFFCEDLIQLMWEMRNILLDY